MQRSAYRDGGSTFQADMDYAAESGGCMRTGGGPDICMGPGALKGVGGKLLQYADPKLADRLTVQLAEDGAKSIFKSLQSLESRLSEHIQKLDSLQFKSSVEREINTFGKQIDTIKQFIKDQGLSK